jgi:hypothetical protein
MKKSTFETTGSPRIVLLSIFLISFAISHFLSGQGTALQNEVIFTNAGGSLSANREVMIYDDIQFTFQLEPGSPFTHVDFNDGNGLRPLVNNSTLNYSNFPRGIRNIDFVIPSSPIIPPPNPSFPPFTPELRSSIEFNAKARESGNNFELPHQILSFPDKCIVSILLGQGNYQLTKPMIFVDGLDLNPMGIKLNSDPTKILGYGSTRIDIFQIGRDEGWIAPGDRETFALYPKAIRDVRALGYDVLFVDFKYGAQDIFKNAKILEEVLDWVNAQSGVCGGNIIVGASMGGQIAKICLADMEKRFKEHRSDLYVSFDSPHTGANIPLGIQALAYFSKVALNNGRNWVALNQDAPKQLLTNNLTSLIHNGQLSWSGLNGGDMFKSTPAPPNGNHLQLRQEYINKVKALGYPKSTRNVAIANGNGLGIQNLPNNGINLLDEAIRVNVDILNIDGNAMQFKLFASPGNTMDFHSLHKRNKTLGVEIVTNRFNNGPSIAAGFVPDIDNNQWDKISMDIRKNPGASFLDMDHVPGGSRNDLYSIKKIFEKEFKSLSDPSFASIQHDKTPSWTPENTCFIPTVSELDIDVPLGTNIENLDAEKNNLTPFKKISYEKENNNLKHVEINSRVLDFLLTELNGVNTSYAQTNMPSIITGLYNMGGTRRNLLSTNIFSGGRFLLNADLPIGNTGNLPTQKNYHPYLTCSNIIEVNQNGRMELGDDMDHFAQLSVLNNSKVKVNAGGLLWVRNKNSRINVEGTVHFGNNSNIRISNGSSIVVQNGGSLIIEEGTLFQLWDGQQDDGNSRIIIQPGGNLIVNGTIQVDGNGYFEIMEGAQVVVNTPGFNFAGWKRDSRALLLHGGLVLNGKDLNISNAKVITKNAIEVKNTRDLTVTNVILTTPGSSDGIVSDNVLRNRVNQSYFSGFIAALTIGNLNHKLGFIEVANSGFENNNIGLHLENISTTVTPRIKTCKFVGNQASLAGLLVDHIKTVYVGNETEFSSFGSEAYQEGCFANAAILSFGAKALTIGNTIFKENYLAINGDPSDKFIGNPKNTYVGGGINNQCGNDIYKTNIFCNGTTFENNHFAIATNGGYERSSGVLLPYGIVQLVCSKFSGNQVNVIGSDIFLAIDGELNGYCNSNGQKMARPNDFVNNQMNSTAFQLCYEQIVNCISNGPCNVNPYHDYFTLSPNNPMVLNARYNHWDQGRVGISNYQVGSCHLRPTNDYSFNFTPAVGSPNSCDFLIEDAFCQSTPGTVLTRNGDQGGLFEGSSISSGDQFRAGMELLVGNEAATSNILERFNIFTTIDSLKFDSLSAQDKYYVWMGLALADTVLFQPNQGDIQARNQSSDLLSKVRVFPNPVSDVLYIELDDKNNYEIVIRNLLGTEMSRTIGSGNQSINVNIFATGMYLLSVKDLSTGKSHVTRVLKH